MLLHSCYHLQKSRVHLHAFPAAVARVSLDNGKVDIAVAGHLALGGGAEKDDLFRGGAGENPGKALSDIGCNRRGCT